MIGMAATFILFAAIGYFIPFEKMLNKGAQAPMELAAGGGGGAVGGGVAMNPAVPQVPQQQVGQQQVAQQPMQQQQVDPQQVAQQQAVQQQMAQPVQQTGVAQQQPMQQVGQQPQQVAQQPVQQVAPQPVVDPNNVPVIETAWVAPHKKSKVQLGYPVSIKAAAPSGDALVYELWTIGGSRPAYTSTNGYFGNVYPVDGGKYELQVKNQRTGDVTKQELSGFNKVQKMSASKLQAQLNADVQEDLFYFMFDMDNLQISYSGIDPSEYPANLNALILDRASSGWNLEVVGTPKYDKYNRIVSFKLNVTYL